MKTKALLAILSLLFCMAEARTLIDSRTSSKMKDLSWAESRKIIEKTAGNLENRTCLDAEPKDKASGSFTAVGSKDTVYLIVDCMDKNHQIPGLNGYNLKMALFSNGKLVKIFTNAGKFFHTLGDVNGDGIDDLAYTTGYEINQNMIGKTEIFSLKNKEFRSILKLDETFFIPIPVMMVHAPTA